MPGQRDSPYEGVAVLAEAQGLSVLFDKPAVMRILFVLAVSAFVLPVLAGCTGQPFGGNETTTTSPPATTTTTTTTVAGTTTTTTTTAAPSCVLRVANMEGSYFTYGQIKNANFRVFAEVDGEPESGVSVSIKMSRLDEDGNEINDGAQTRGGTTDSTGKVQFSRAAGVPGTYRGRVLSLTMSGCAYDPDQNGDWLPKDNPDGEPDDHYDVVSRG